MIESEVYLCRTNKLSYYAKSFYRNKSASRPYSSFIRLSSLIHSWNPIFLDKQKPLETLFSFFRKYQLFLIGKTLVRKCKAEKLTILNNRKELTDTGTQPSGRERWDLNICISDGPFGSFIHCVLTLLCPMILLLFLV